MSPADKCLFFSRSVVQAIKAHEFTEKTDVWAWGVFGWELTTNCEFPYVEYPDNDDLTRRIFAGLRLQRKGGVSDDVWAVLSACWKETPASRPSFDTLVIMLGDADGNDRSVLQVSH